MYRHAYSDYVGHILNKSPSKAAYSFTRAPRFPQTKDIHPPIQQPFLAANGFEYSDGSRHVQERPTFHRPYYCPNTARNQNEKERSKSKSPTRTPNSRRNNLTSKGLQDKNQQTIKKSLSKANVSQRSKSKSPTCKKRHSPTKTYTEESDNSPKKRTLTGYYPTGYELSPNGKYFLSSIKNTPAHSFGRSQQRYYYVPKSDDEVGPAFYHPFSEFGYSKK